MNFEWYKPKRNRPFVSIVKYRINFSDSLIEEMRRPEYVELGYSDETNLMAIKPCIKDSEYAIKVTGRRVPKILNRGFIRFLIGKGIQIENKTRKYIAVWNAKDGICIVELKG